ncbi:hypothetical protein [Nocardia amikacinitolerans]|uniref:hypothetical protein n=1 Tax=Nocardia amikacinitolerans TaxID=756689 RepID=UPI0012EEAE25|nr:hypothetical protein [Nocardia amikacinitolerans]
MRYYISRFGLIVTTVGAVLSVLASPVTAAPTPVKAKACDFSTTFSRPTLLHPVISADARAICDVPPESHSFEFSLEHVNAGRWVRWALTVDSAVPYPNERRYQVSAECETGEWRHKVRVYGSLQGRPFDFTETGDTRTVTSSECPRG